MVILVVDDDELVRRVVTELLEDCDFSVIEARSGSEALALVRYKPDLDLVISDVNMPEMDGLQLIGELRAIRPSLPIILMSGRPYHDRSYPFLAKPFTQQSLLACIARAKAPPLHSVEDHRPVPPA